MAPDPFLNKDNIPQNEALELKEYQQMEHLVQNKLIRSAPEGKNPSIRDSPEFLRVLRQELSNFVSLEQHENLKDKYFRKLEDNKILLDKIHEIERSLK